MLRSIYRFNYQFRSTFLLLSRTSSAMIFPLARGIRSSSNTFVAALGYKGVGRLSCCLIDRLGTIGD